MIFLHAHFALKKQNSPINHRSNNVVKLLKKNWEKKKINQQKQGSSSKPNQQRECKAKEIEKMFKNIHKTMCTNICLMFILYTEINFIAFF